MALIDEMYLNKLRAAGLHVSDPIAAFGNGVWVCKPTSTPGNNILGYSSGYVSLEGEAICPETDAPMLKLILHDGIWQVNGQLGAGGMLPSDFIDDWTNAEDAVQDILDYYFGNPLRMQKKAAEEEAFRIRCEALKEKKKGEASQQST